MMHLLPIRIIHFPEAQGTGAAELRGGGCETTDSHMEMIA